MSTKLQLRGRRVALIALSFALVSVLFVSPLVFYSSWCISHIGASVTNETSTHLVTSDEPVPYAGVCSSPVFYTVCGNRVDCAVAAATLYRTTYAWLDNSRSNEVKFVVFVGEEIYDRYRIVMPSIYVEVPALDYASCGLDLGKEEDWQYVKVPVLGRMSRIAPNADCIIYADADEIVAGTMDSLWKAANQTGGFAPGMLYAKSNGVVGTNSSDYGHAGWLWAEYRPDLLQNISRVPDVDGGNFAVRAGPSVIGPIVSEFCRILYWRRSTPHMRNPLAGPLLSYVIGVSSPVPYATVDYALMDSLVGDPVTECRLPPNDSSIVWTRVDQTIPNKNSTAACIANRSMMAAATRPGRLHELLHTTTIVSYPNVGDCKVWLVYGLVVLFIGIAIGVVLVSIAVYYIATRWIVYEIDKSALVQLARDDTEDSDDDGDTEQANAVPSDQHETATENHDAPVVRSSRDDEV